ncbi:hypothetical protein B0H34DRAFT_792182 [Crassisporium funariophilum]|nr:hypothetical protein B0H34DRAFT_792182 [Crassisporium funariophilum]
MSNAAAKAIPETIVIFVAEHQDFTSSWMMDTKIAEGYQPYSYDDPSANLWSAYLSKSEKYDKTLALNWKGDMDAILIFAGLFSASVTAFIIESYKTLNPDPNNTTVFLLAQISQQLASMSNSNATSAMPSLVELGQESFSPSISAIVCNVLWFLSLAFSLICALSATLVEGWTRHYLQACNSKPAPQDRARITAYLFQGIKKYRMATVVETIPMLLHTSLFFFFAGLVAFLIPINSSIEYLILGMLIICCSLYFLVTILPIFRLACPFWTPASNLCWSLLQKLEINLYRKDIDGNERAMRCTMSEARELDAIEITPERDERDLKAMCWTLSALREDSEFEPFVNVIPSVISGYDYSAKLLMDNLLNHTDIHLRLGYRLPRLLATCVGGLVEPSVAHNRATTCLKAMWSLTMLSMPKINASDPASFRANVKFKEDTFDLLRNVESAVPSVEDYTSSAMTVVARSIMDMQVDRAVALEEQALELLRTGTPELKCAAVARGSNHHLSEQDSVIEGLKHRMMMLEKHIVTCQRLTKPLPHVMIEAAASHQTRLMALATNPSDGANHELIHVILDSMQNFQTILNQAGFLLALEYTARILSSESLPHEAFNTIRRTFFRLNFQLPFTKVSQERLVNYLEEALEQTATGSTRLPQSIIDILLGLTRALKDPLCVMKAKAIIKNYMKHTRNEAAPQAYTILEKTMPRDPEVDLPLDLFSSHIYADAKPYRNPKRSATSTSINL